jgi:hypothetical protein
VQEQQDPSDKVKELGKSTEGASKVESFYDGRLAKLVSDAYEEDFAMFQYPLWDGESMYQDRQF